MAKTAAVAVSLTAGIVLGAALLVLIPGLRGQLAPTGARPVELEELSARLERSFDERIRKIENRLGGSAAQVRPAAAPRKEEEAGDGWKDFLLDLEARVETLTDRLEELETQLAGL